MICTRKLGNKEIQKHYTQFYFTAVLVASSATLLLDQLRRCQQRDQSPA